MGGSEGMNGCLVGILRILKFFIDYVAVKVFGLWRRRK
jgi:hypothetical protein